MDRGAWQAAIHRVRQTRTQLKQFSMLTRSIIITTFYFSAMLQSKRDLSSASKDQTLTPLQWKPCILTPGASGKSSFYYY